MQTKFIFALRDNSLLEKNLSGPIKAFKRLINDMKGLKKLEMLSIIVILQFALFAFRFRNQNFDFSSLWPSSLYVPCDDDGALLYRYIVHYLA